MATQVKRVSIGARSGSRRARANLGSRLWAKGLPSGRAVVGGLLVAVAMLTVTLAARRTGNTTVRVLVAAHDLPAGTVLTTSDLAATKVDIPDAQLKLLVQDPARLTGTALDRRLASGELFGASDVVARDVAAARSSATVRLEPERALAGALRTGDVVAVVATFDDCSSVIAAKAIVVDVGTPSSELGGQGVLVTLDLANDNETVAVVNASQAGHITLIRSAGTTPQSCAPGSQALDA